MNWKELVGSVAPMLGTALGGPFGGMAGTWLAGELGVPEDQLESTVLSSNPESLFKIKELDSSFKVEMRRLGLEEKQLAANDRANARTMAASTTLLPQIILAIVFVTGFILILRLVFIGEVSLVGSMEGIANYLLGILSAGIVQIMNFFFGSSAGSKEKTVQLGVK